MMKGMDPQLQGRSMPALACNGLRISVVLSLASEAACCADCWLAASMRQGCALWAIRLALRKMCLVPNDLLVELPPEWWLPEGYLLESGGNWGIPFYVIDLLGTQA
jgi:hypothetical protein